MEFPRIVIAALRGGAGKTTLSIGIIAAWKARGKSIAPFKKGPDYIDTGWLALAAGRPCYNLDTFLIEKEDVLSSFFTRTRQNDLAVIEGNRGLYDGIDIEGTTSTLLDLMADEGEGARVLIMRRICELVRARRDKGRPYTMRVNPDVQSIFDFQFDDFQLENYNPDPHIKAPVAI